MSAIVPTNLTIAIVTFPDVRAWEQQPQFLEGKAMNSAII